MGRSFVLRDRDGKTCGYLMQGMRVLRCRLDAKKESAEAVLFFEDGTNRHERMEETGREYVWVDDGRELSGVAAVQDGRLIADAGEESRRRFERLALRRRADARPEEQAKKACRPVENAPREPERTESEAHGERDAPVFPQQRWPPPVCWQNAVYAGGKWIEKEP